MKILKTVRGHDIALELDKIKSYRRFTLYQVSTVKGGVKVPIYKECFTNLELRNIILNGYELDEDKPLDIPDIELSRLINGNESEDETFEYLLADLLEVNYERKRKRNKIFNVRKI